MPEAGFFEIDTSTTRGKLLAGLALVGFGVTMVGVVFGLPHFSRHNLPLVCYRMRITYFPHSGTRVNTEVVGISAGEHILFNRQKGVYLQYRQHPGRRVRS